MTISSTPGWTALHLMFKFPLITAISLSAIYFYEPAPKPMIAITFDDGRKSVVSTALPLLSENDMVATAYITTGFLSTPTFMNPEDIVTLSINEWEIGAHTIDHPNLLTVREDVLIKNLIYPKEYLSYLTGNDIVSFASPYAEYNDEMLTHVAQYYDTHVQSTITGLNFPDSFDQYEIGRLDVTKEKSLKEICEAISIVKEAELLVLMFHDIVETEGNWNTDYETFEYIVECIKRSGADVVTVTEGVSRMKDKFKL